ncbi:MAG: M6 family metalloprotease domain-containing protein [Gemmatimonadales bacterium]|jgi:M6 family metalloprotease-like protein
MRVTTRAVGLATLGSLLLAATSGVAAGQDVEMLGRIHGIRPPPGYYDVLARDPNAYRFQEVWTRLGRRVMERRFALTKVSDFAALNAHFDAGRPSVAAAQASGSAVAGALRIPVLAGVFSDSTHIFLPDTASLRNRLWGTAAAPPYSVTTFYAEMSNGLMQITGDIIGWFAVDSTSTWYEGSNNGLDPTTDHTGDLIRELLDAADPLVDFRNYDNDNNGRVDLIAVLHPLKDGACRTTHLWAHRWVYSAWAGGPYVSNDGVTVNDYLIQSAVGGSSGCDSTLIMPIGTLSHELGHGIGLPDLYDLSGTTNGIGHWGLMGSGNWNVQTSPAHMAAWSKSMLGWIVVDTLSDSGRPEVAALHPVVSNDTALHVSIEGTSEYFLLENRQRVGSETALHGEGLAIWHVDPDLIQARLWSNTVNSVEPHGLDLEQADGLDDLGNKENRGDEGDPYPGSTGNTEFSTITLPDSKLNGGSDSGVRIDSITLNTDKSIAFRVSYFLVKERLTTSVGAGTYVIVDGAAEDAPHDTDWVFPGVREISVPSLQGDTLVRHGFRSWSDGGERTHTVTVDAIPDTFTANLETEHRLRAMSDAHGTVTGLDVSLDESGIAWLPPTAQATLVAAPVSQGYHFAAWTGDTTFTRDTLVLAMSKPHTVEARFALPVAIQTQSLANAVMGAGGYADTLIATGGLGSYTWSLVEGALPTGLSLDGASGSISGTAVEDGSFEIVVQAVSGALSARDTVNLTVTRPILALNAVVDQLLGTAVSLTPDERRFLDLIGNENGRFDIGDFRAFLQESGISVAPVLADLTEPPSKAADREEGQ